MKAWWQLWSKAFTPSECAEIVAYMLKQRPVQAVVGHGGQATKSDIRKSTVYWINRTEPILWDAFARIDHMVRRSNAEAFGFDIAHNHEVQGTEYNADRLGKYDWHEDNTWVPQNGNIFDRKLSVVVQLSPADNYEGGRLELDRDGLPSDRFCDVGDLIIFPSFLRHRVTPVTKGVRYSLVTWYQGPRFR